MRRRTLAILAPLAALLVIAAVAAAFFSAAGSGVGAASAGTINAPGAPSVPGTSDASVPLTWTAATLSPAAPAVAANITYSVQRSDDGGASWDPAAGSCSGGVGGTSCSDSAPDGSFVYRVRAHLEDWTAASGSSSTVNVDATPPAVQSIARASSNPTGASSVDFTVTFSESVTGVGEDDFAAVGTVSGEGVTGVSGSGGLYTVTVSAGTGEGTVGLNLVDDDSIADAVSNPLGGAGTGNGDFTGEVYTVDASDPTVTSIARTSATPTNAASVSFTVTFSESVSGVDATDFAFGPGAPSGASVSGVTGTGSTRTVSVATGSVDGTLRLDVSDDDTIVDGAGRKLGGTGLGNGSFTTGESYAIDKTAPALTALEMRDDDADGRVDRVVATFNESLAPYTAANAPWTVSNHPSGGALSSVSVSGSAATLTLTEGAGAQNTAVGLFKVALTQNANGIRDALGHQSSFAATAPVDKASPVPVTFTDGSGTTDGRAQPGDSFTVTFSESVTNTNASASNVVIQPGSGSTTDFIAMPGLMEGTAALNRSDYVTGNSAANFNNSTLSSPVGSPEQLRVTLSTCTGGGCSGTNANSTASGVGSLSYTPANGIFDLFSNGATSNFAAPIRLF